MRATNQSAQSRRDFIKVERLSKIIVGTAIQPDDPIGHPVPRCQQKNRSVIAALTHRFEDVEPGPVGQHEVKHNGVELVVPENATGLIAGFDGIGVKSGQRQSDLEPVPQNGIIFDNKYAHRNGPME